MLNYNAQVFSSQINKTKCNWFYNDSKNDSFEKDLQSVENVDKKHYQKTSLEFWVFIVTYRNKIILVAGFIKCYRNNVLKMYSEDVRNFLNIKIHKVVVSFIN